MAKSETSSLYKALESFGRRGKRLSAARLEQYPDVLVEIFGRDLVTSAADRRDAAEMVESGLKGIIASIPNPTDRRIADAIFAMSPEFWDKNVTERQEYVDKEECPLFTRELFKTQRARILADITLALPRVVGVLADARTGVVLSSEARHAVSQLYRYLQDAVLRMDAYDFCANAIQEVEAVNKYSRKAKFVPTRRDLLFDEALWSYTYSHYYFEACLRQPTARSFLREGLPDDWWRGTRFIVPFLLDDRKRLLAALGAATLDNARTFCDELLSSKEGTALYERWMSMLGSTKINDWTYPLAQFMCPGGLERRLLIKAMKQLCGLLQLEFRDRTVSKAEVEKQFDIQVGGISMFALQQVRIYEYNKDGAAIHCHTDRLMAKHPYPYKENVRDADSDYVDWRYAEPWWV